MSKAAFWQRGEAIDYVNDTNEKIEANKVLVIGSLIGVAGTDIAPGETGAVHIEGVFEIPKSETAVLAIGDVVAFTADKIAKCAAGGKPCGVAVAAATDADPTALVKINIGAAPTA